MSKDIFAQESKILSEAKTNLSDEPIRPEIYAELVSNYGKLLRTTKKIINAIHSKIFLYEFLTQMRAKKSRTSSN